MNRFIRKIFVFLWAVSVLWIMTGSLINFHQYKIWKRPLNIQLIAVKRDKEKVISIQKLHVPGLTKDHQFLSDLHENNYFFTGNYSSGEATLLRIQHRILVHFTSTAGFRAPPLA